MHDQNIPLLAKILNELENLSSIEDRGQTDRVNALPSPHALVSTDVAGLSRATRMPRRASAQLMTWQ